MLQDTREAKALGYCEIAKLSRDALVATSCNYPDSAAVIREAGLKVAVARAMMVISMYARACMRLSSRRGRRERERKAAEEARAAAIANGWPLNGGGGPPGMGAMVPMMGGVPGQMGMPPWGPMGIGLYGTAGSVAEWPADVP